jgi:hypothetical protein
MTPNQIFKKYLLISGALLTLSAGAFAATSTGNGSTGTPVSAAARFDNSITINEKLLQSFKQTFPDAEQVKWMEAEDKYTVNFKEKGILTKIEYDKEGNFLSSLRYYTEKNLPINILCRLQKKYADKKVFGVTEMATETSVEYYIKLEDDNSWMTVRSGVDGNLQVVEKYKKAS